MQCKTCGHDNPADAKFCGGCGATLEPVAASTPPTPSTQTEAQGKAAGFWRKNLLIVGSAACVIAVIAVMVWLGQRSSPETVGIVTEPDITQPPTTATTQLPAVTSSVRVTQSPQPQTTLAPTTSATRPAEGIQVGNSAPGFTLSYLDGRKVSLADFRGSPVLLNFWATWCGPCKSEMPYLEQVHSDWRSKGLVMLAVDLGEPASTVQKFVEANHLSIPVLLDPSQTLGNKYGVYAIPTTYFIDADGVIRASKIGSFTSKAAIESEINKLLAR